MASGSVQELVADVPKTPEGLLAAYVYAQESGQDVRLEELEQHLDSPGDCGRLRTLVATMVHNQGLFPVPLRAQTRLGDRYRLVREIGAGGFGKVWQAADERLDDRMVAIKVLNGLASARDVHQDLERERKALARAQHPGIVPVLDVGDHEGNPFLVMELVDGVTLAELLTRVGQHSGGTKEAALAELPGMKSPPDWWTLCARVVSEVLGAVQAAHDVGIFHRDIKPGNVMIRPDGQAVLLDFGVARIADQDGQATLSGFAGTLAYMAPEQVGRVDREHPERVDVYQMGRLFYELLSLTPAVPHDLPFGELLERARAGDIASPRQHCRDIPRMLEAICLRALEPNPDRRYESAQQFRMDLDAFLSHEVPRHVSTTRQAVWWYGARRLLRKHRRGVWIATGCLAGLLASIPLLAWNDSEPAFVGRPVRQGSEFVQTMKLPNSSGEVFGFVSVLSELLVETSRIPLHLVDRSPLQDSGEVDLWRVVMALPPGVGLPGGLPKDQIVVHITELSGGAAQAMGAFLAAQRTWLADPINATERGVPYATVMKMAVGQARGSARGEVDLLGEGWAQASLGEGM